MNNFSVLIPVYRNKAEFLKNLKNNKPYLKDCEVIVINDDPGTRLETEVKQIIPKAIIINNPANYGFAKTVNLGAKQAQHQYLFLLNSDVILKDLSYLKALKLFAKQSNLFAVTFAQIEKNGQITGANTGKFKQGLFHHAKRITNQISENFWPEGGASIVDKAKFMILKGFDEDYSPFYWEDVDLGYRAKKLGLVTLFHPKIKVIHHHETTIAKYFSKEQISIIAYRNQFLFVWKNIRGINLVKHCFWLPILLIKNRNNPLFFQGLAQAFSKLMFKK